MELSVFTCAIVWPLAFLGGFVDSIAGGGGLITLPAYLLAGVPVHGAIGTNKVTSLMGALVSTWRYWRRGFADMGFIWPSMAAALAGSALGAHLTLLVPSRYLEWLLMAVLPLTAFVVLKPKTLRETPAEGLSRPRGMALAALISLAVGTYDGFYGPGTGTFLLVLYSALVGLDVRSANGCTKMVNTSSNLAAFAVFMVNGQALVLLGLTAGLFNMAGQWFGSGLAMDKGSRVVRPMIIVVLALLLVKVASGR